MAEKIGVKWNHERSFVCVDYPAVVNNVDKMLETIGGQETVTKIYKDPTLRLPLRFRPKDVFCKPMYGDKANVTRILLKVRRPKIKESNSEDATPTDCKVEMLGVIDRTYKFKAMADFQYLTVMKSEDGAGSKSNYDDIVPTTMHPLSWLNESAPMFLPPIVFSRMDSPCDYDFRKDVVITGGEDQQNNENSPRISHNRRNRCGFAIYAKFEQKEVPVIRREGCMKRVTDMGFKDDQIQEIEQAFLNRPIWSKLALRICLKHSNINIGYLLPAVAYYFVNGPWRSLWVRYGYDPRKDPTAKIYQMIDLRLKQFGETIPLHSKWRGQVYGAIAKISPHNLEKATLIHKEDLIGSGPSCSSQLTEAEVEEKSKYSYYKGVVPTRRQSILQLCDIYLEELQTLVCESGRKENKCDEKDGWFESGFTVKCRAILLNDIRSSISAVETETEEPMDTETRNESEASSEEYDEDE